MLICAMAHKMSMDRKCPDSTLSRSWNMLLKELKTPAYDIISNVTHQMIAQLQDDVNMSEFVEAAQRCVNHFVQEGGKYSIKMNCEHLNISVNTNVKLDDKMYKIIGKRQRNMKDANQMINVALSVAFIEHHLIQRKNPKLVDYDSTDDDEIIAKFSNLEVQPQGPETINPEDEMEQTEVTRIAANTEISQAADVVTAPFMLTSDFLQHAATTLKKITISELTERNIVIASGSLTTSMARGDVVFELPLPAAIYDNLDSSTSTPLRPFTLIKTDLEITLKLNSNQAQCGRFVLAAYPCKDQAYGAANTVFQAIQREHIEINVSTSADAILTIKYENLRPFLPIQSNEIGEVTGDTYTTLVLWCLSPLNVIAGASPTVPYQVFARFVDPYLTAMRYPISTIPTNVVAQGPLEAQASTPVKAKAIETVKDVTNSLKAIPIFGPIFKILANIGSSATTSISRLVASEDFTQRLENNLVYVGLKNKDKPIDIRPPTLFQPIAQKALCQGLGPIAATKMRLEMVSNTAHVKDFDTVQTTHSMSKIAQIGGVQAFATISDTNSTGDLLLELPAVPFDTRYPSETLVATPNTRVLPPVTYLSLLNQGYVGNLEYEFIPVKTASHNFSIMVAFVPFHGTPGTTTYEQAQSCHYKIIDFRTNDTGVFTVPYVSTQMFRQYPSVETGLMFSRNLNTAIYDTAQLDGSELFTWKDPGKICVFLVNTLNPTPIVAPNIEMIVKVRASSNFQYTIPSAPRMRNGYNQNTLVLRPILTNVTSLNTGVIPQGPIQTESKEELPGDEVPPLGGPQLQTMELHDDILNIARRTMRYATVETTPMLRGGAYFPMAGVSAYIPIVPNDPLFFTTWNGASTLNSLELTPRSVRDALSAMFRFSRGGVILSLINHSTQNLVITHLPPMSRPIYLNGFDGSNAPFTPVLPDGAVPMSSMESLGYATVRNVPSVNEVTDIEIPFYNCNYYTDLQARYGLGTSTALNNNAQSMVNGNFYDVIARTLGTLKIQNEETYRTLQDAQAARARVTIKMSLADDFEYYHFLGTPPVIVNYQLNPNRRLPSQRPMTAQQINTALTRSGIEKNPGPVVREPVVAQGPDVEAQGIWDFLTDLVSAPSEVKKLRQQGDYFTKMAESLKERMGTVFKISMTEAASLAVTILTAFIHPNKMTILSAVVQLLVALKIVSDEFLLKIIMGTKENEENAQGPLDNQRPQQNWIVPLFTTAFIEYCIGLKKGKVDENLVHKQTVLEKFQGVFEGINWFRASAIMVIISRVVVAMNWLFTKASVWLMPSTSYDLLNQDPKFIANFMKDYTYIMNELNKNSLIGIRQCKDRFWTTLLIAYYLKGIMAKENTRNAALLSACNDVIKKANDLSVMLSSPPVRFEPFVVWTFGEPGVGKSFNLSRQMVKMVNEVDGPGKIISPNPIYTRDPKSEWWNNYHGQPIVLYDDVGCVSSPEVDTLLVGELMALKSCAVMPIGKPRAEEKEVVMTSLVVGIASNFPYLNSNVIKDSNAMDRRRDVLVKCAFTEEAQDYIKKHNKVSVAESLPEEMRKDNGHLRYGIYDDPVRVRTMQAPGSQDLRRANLTVLPDRWLTPKEYEDHLHTKFSAYYTKELANMTARYKDMLKLCPAYAQGLTDEASIKAAVLQLTLSVEESDSTTTMDTLHYLIHRIENSTPEYYKKLPLTTKSQLSTLKRMGQVRPEGPTVNVDMAKFAPNHWIYENHDNDGMFVSFLKKMYDTIVPWHAPLYCHTNIELDDEIKCIFCGNKPATVTYICDNATMKHVACECKINSVLKSTQVKCSLCDKEMKCIIRRDPRTLYTWMMNILNMAKEVVANPLARIRDNEFIKKNMTNIIVSGLLALSVAAIVQGTTYTLENDLHKQFFKYIGELPAMTTEALGKVYIMTQNGLRFLCFWNTSKNEYEFVAQPEVEAEGNNSFEGLTEDDDTNKWIDPKSKKKKKIEKHANNLKSPTPSTSTDVISYEDLQKNFGKPKNETPSEPEITDDSEPEIELVDGEPLATRFLKYLKTLVNKDVECMHEKENIERFINTPIKYMQATVDHHVTIYWEDESTGENTGELIFHICCEKCKLLDDVVIKHFSAFFEVHSPMWNISIKSKMDYCVPEVYLLFLKSLQGQDLQPDAIYDNWQQRICESFKNKFLKGMNVVWDFIKTHYVTFIGSLTIIYCIYKGYSWYRGDDGIYYPVEGQGGGESSMVVRSQKQIRQGTTRQLNSGYLNATAQGLYVKEPNPTLIARANKLRRNYFTFKLGALQIYALGLYDNIALITRHNWHYIKFYANVTNNDAITIICSGRDNVNVKLSDIMESLDMANVEHVLLSLPKRGMQAFSDIRSSFIPAYKKDDDGNLVPTNPVIPAGIYFLDVNDALILKSASLRNVVPGHEILTTFKYGTTETSYQNYETTSLQMLTTTVQAKGLCLAAFMDNVGNIIGFHVAGNPRTGEGYIAIIYKDMIPTPDITQPDTVQPEGPSDDGLIEGWGPVKKSVGLVYETTIFDAPYHTFKSKIIPSPLQSELYEPEKQPCIQSKHDPRYKYDEDPLIDGVATIGNRTLPLKTQQLTLSYECVRDELLRVLPAPYMRPPVDDDEVMYATKAPESTGMNLGTSAGYPLARKMNKEKQKRDFVGNNGKLLAATQKKFDEAYRSREVGCGPNTIFWAHLKDELRKVEKLMKQGGTRVFSVAPFELVYNTRKALLPFMDAYQTHPIEAHHAIGLNPNSDDWRRLRYALLEKGSKLIQMDFKNYSDAIPTECVKLAFQIIKDYYKKYDVLDDELSRVIDTIYRDTAESKILVYDAVYRVLNGVLAGHPLTSIVNSIVNLVLQVYAWLILTGRRPSEFFKLSYIIVMGDDVVISIPDWIVEEYNCKKICEVFKKYNIIATDSSKNLENIKPYDEFEEFEFLSRGMSEHPALPGIVLAPVKTIALFDCPLWVNRGDTEEQTIQSIQAALLLAFDHGPTFFEKFKSMLITCSKAPKYDYFTWFEVLALFYGSAFILENVETCRRGGRLTAMVEEKKPLALTFNKEAFDCLNNTYVGVFNEGASEWIVSQDHGRLVLVEDGKKKSKTTPLTTKRTGVKPLNEDGMFRKVLGLLCDGEPWECYCKYDCVRELKKREREVAERRKTKTKKMEEHVPTMEVELARCLAVVGDDAMGRSYQESEMSEIGYMSHEADTNEVCVEHEPQEGVLLRLK